jgi:group I intron endonuclease
MKKIVGIYKITNLKNNKVYVGSAVNINGRFKTHKRLLKNNKHFNNHLQYSFNKYGLDNFKYEIIEITTLEELYDKETFWINKFNSNNPKYGYNKRIVVNSNLGIKLSDETRRKLSESHLGHKRSSDTNQKIIESQYKKICQFTKKGEFIQVFGSLQDAAKSLNKNYTTSITACLKKKLPSAFGFLWCYEEEKEFFKPIPLKKRGKNKQKLKITCIISGNVTIFASMTDAIDMLKMSSSTIYKGIKEKKYKNLIWEKI